MILVTHLVWCQDDFTFKILINKGQNVVKTSDGKVIDAKTGILLNSPDQVITAEEGYLGLMHKSGKILDVKGKGEYVINELEQKINLSKTNPGDKYAQFISSRLSDGEKQRMRSEFRALGDRIRVWLPESVELFESSATIIWESGEFEDYELILKNILDEPLYAQKTTSNKVSVDFSEIEDESGIYLVSISADDASVGSTMHSIRYRKDNIEQSLVDELSSLKASFSGDSPMEQLILASFYEENGYLLDALTVYDEAVTKYPEEIAGFYDLFLEQNGLK
jgi:hypothetical protein